MAETQQSETVTTTTTETVQEERSSSLFSDILTIIGFAILFIIIIWGLVHLVELISSSVSGNFAKPQPTIQVNVPGQATSGQPITVSWNYAPTVTGNYAFLYQCQTGLSFEMQQATSSEVSVPCGAAYTVPSSNNSFTVIPTLSATSSVNDTVSVVFIPTEGSTQVQGNATMVISPVAKPVTTAPAKTTTSYVQKTSSYTSTSYSGPAQLSVRIIGGSINANGDGTVSFDIANVGGSTSGSYYFSAQIPTQEPYPYQSPLQAPLAPGSHITSTLNFTDAASGGGEFAVTIEGANSSSGYASIDIPGPSYNYNNSQPYVQYPSYTY